MCPPLLARRSALRERVYEVVVVRMTEAPRIAFCGATPSHEVYGDTEEMEGRV